MLSAAVEPGTVVLCRAGREKGRFLVVISSDSECVYLADGKERKLSAPKKKNIKHIQLTSTVIGTAGITDKALRGYLSNFNIGGCEACQRKM